MIFVFFFYFGKVGVGVIGCEYFKNFVMMGIGCSVVG